MKSQVTLASEVTRLAACWVCENIEDVERYLGLNLLGQIPNKQDTGRGKRYYAQYSSGQ